MILAGIDYSMTSPALAIFDSEKELKFENLVFYNINDRKKTKLDKGNVHISLLESWKTPEQRYDQLSDWAMNILFAHRVEKVFLEGYSMGSSSGLVFNIAENTGALKQKLYKVGIPIVPQAPSAVKKQFTGKGNAKKDAMCDRFYARFGVKFHEMYGGRPYDSPENDMVDAFANLELGLVTS